MSKRGPPCSICQHQRRHQIEIGLVNHVPVNVLARRFECSRDAINRHKRRHISPQIAAAILTAQRPSAVDLESLQRSESEGLLSQLVVQAAHLRQHADMALELGNVSAAVAAERAILANLELRGKLNGQFVQRHEVTRLSVLLSPDWGRIRQVFSNTFAQFPEAKPASLAFAAALHAMETDAAKEITERKTPLVLEHEATA